MISVGINVGYVPRVVVEGTGNDPSGRDCIEHISIEVHPDADDLGSGQLLDGAMDYFEVRTGYGCSSCLRRNKSGLRRMSALGY